MNMQEFKEIVRNSVNSAFRSAVGAFIGISLMTMLLFSVPYALAQRIPSLWAMVFAISVAIILTMLGYMKDKDDLIESAVRKYFD